MTAALTIKKATKITMAAKRTPKVIVAVMKLKIVTVGIPVCFELYVTVY